LRSSPIGEGGRGGSVASGDELALIVHRGGMSRMRMS
jgi:hypothetical protein